MHLEIITIYAVCDDVLQALGVTDDLQATMTTAEMMTTALVAARWFGGCLETSRALLQEHGYTPHMLGKRRFNRHMHAIPETHWQAVLAAVAYVHHTLNAVITDVQVHQLFTGGGLRQHPHSPLSQIS